MKPQISSPDPKAKQIPIYHNFIGAVFEAFPNDYTMIIWIKKAINTTIMKREFVMNPSNTFSSFSKIFLELTILKSYMKTNI